MSLRLVPWLCLLSMVVWPAAAAAISGYVAIALLGLCLMLGLVRRSGRGQAPRSWQRDSGMRCAECTMLHVAWLMATQLDWRWRTILVENWLQFGVAAAAILLVLWITSWPRLVKLLRLGPVWSSLHRSVHLVPVLIAAHVAMTPSIGALGIRVTAVLLVGWYLLRGGHAITAPLRTCAGWLASWATRLRRPRRLRQPQMPRVAD